MVLEFLQSCMHEQCTHTPPWLCLFLQLGRRLAHVLRRILPISLYLLQKDGRCLAGHDLFLKRVGQAYSTFIEEVTLILEFALLACSCACLINLGRHEPLIVVVGTYAGSMQHVRACSIMNDASSPASLQLLQHCSWL